MGDSATREPPKKTAETPKTTAQPTETSTPGELPSEWAPVEPTDKGMGLTRLTLDKGVKTTAIGQLYGLDFEIDGKGFVVRVFFDKYNRRLKVQDYEATDYRAMAARLNWLAKENDFDKIFLKATREDWQLFLGLGYLLEGILKYYFHGEDAYVMSKFATVERMTSTLLFKENELIESLMKGSRDYQPPPLPEGYTMVVAGDKEIPGLVALYRRVFRTYPSPLTHPDYIQQTMARNIVYRAVLNKQGNVVSAASAEIDEKHANAELTDCATQKSERGKGLMYHLLRALEDDLRQRQIITGYTLARAPSVGMNRVFYRLGYEFTGRLINNCDIYGQFEDMNIWVKPLLGAAATR